MGITGIHAIPMMITCMLQGTLCDTGIPCTFYGETFAVYSMADARNGFELFFIVVRTPSRCGLSVPELRSEPRAHWSHVRSVIRTQISNLYSFQRKTLIMTTELLFPFIF